MILKFRRLSKLTNKRSNEHMNGRSLFFVYHPVADHRNLMSRKLNKKKQISSEASTFHKYLIFNHNSSLQHAERNSARLYHNSRLKSQNYSIRKVVSPFLRFHIFRFLFHSVEKLLITRNYLQLKVARLSPSSITA